MLTLEERIAGPTINAWLIQRLCSPVPGHPVRFKLPDGSLALATAQEIIAPPDQASWAFSRGAGIRRALALHLRSRFHPEQRGGDPWWPSPSDPGMDTSADTIEPLLNHPLWSAIDAYAAPLNLANTKGDAAMAADVLYRDQDTGRLSLAMVHTRPANSLPAALYYAELGAAITMLEGHTGVQVQDAVVIWAAPGRTEVTIHAPDPCRIHWSNAITRWRSQAAQEPQEAA